MSGTIDWLHINSDTNGNPRYVCHFSNFITDQDRADVSHTGQPMTIGEKYSLALARAKCIGGKKFHNKQYGGGIVFKSYNLPKIEAAIHAINSAEKHEHPRV